MKWDWQKYTDTITRLEYWHFGEIDAALSIFVYDDGRADVLFEGLRHFIGLRFGSSEEAMAEVERALT